MNIGIGTSLRQLRGSVFRSLALVCLLSLLSATSQSALAEESAPVDLERYLANERIMVIQSQKFLDAGEYADAVQLLDLGIAKFPGRDDLYALKGEALYKSNRLEEAETMLRQALRLNPLNQVAKKYIEEIRTTEQAQVSTEWQEWMAVFRDKVGDYIVTFLAFATAFLVGQLIEPVKFKIRVHRTRKLFEQGHYDEFLDMTEGLLDEEAFGPLRDSFRYLLRQKSFEEAKTVLTRYINTPERLPTLLRILERERERMHEEAVELETSS